MRAFAVDSFGATGSVHEVPAGGRGGRRRQHREPARQAARGEGGCRHERTSAETARSLGAEETVDYNAGDAAEQIRARYPNGVDAPIDLHSDADEFAKYASLVREGGIAVSSR